MHSHNDSTLTLSSNKTINTNVSIPRLISPLTRSAIDNFPVAYTMALGGVDTGSTYANEHVTATGNMRNNGLLPILSL